jgi:alpha-tubulin suppressor-like RCC1 family protein
VTQLECFEEVLIPNVKIRKAVAATNYSFFISDTGRVFSVGWNNAGCLGTNNEEQFCSQITEIKHFSDKSASDVKIIDVAASHCYTLFIDSEYNIYGCGQTRTLDVECGVPSLFDHKVKLLPNEKIVQIECEWHFVLFLTNLKRLICVQGTAKEIFTNVDVLHKDCESNIVCNSGNDWFRVRGNATSKLTITPAQVFEMHGINPEKCDSYQGHSFLLDMNAIKLPSFIHDCRVKMFASDEKKYFLLRTFSRRSY